MHAENVWKWLDAVDQDNLDLLDQWGVPPQRCPHQHTPPPSNSVSDGGDMETYQQYNNKRNAEVASFLESIPPAGILLRNGSIRVTSQNSKVFACDVENDNHPQSLLPGFPTTFARVVENKDHFQSLIPGFATRFEATGQQTDASPARQLQVSGREGNSESTNPKRLPTFSERARVGGPSGALYSTPIIHVEVKDSVAINCQGAKVVGEYQQNGLRGLPSMAEKSRRNSTSGEEVLHRNNATRRLSNWAC